jgi:hypothetical protein
VSNSAIDRLIIKRRLLFDLFVWRYQQHLAGSPNPYHILLQVDNRGVIRNLNSRVIRVLSARLD